MKPLSMKYVIGSLACLFLMSTLAGCASREKMIADINYVLEKTDREWAVKNEEDRQTNGTRHLKFGKERCFAAAEATLTTMGFTVRKRDYDSGFLRGNAVAPAPFDRDEWTQIREVELKRMHEIAKASKPHTMKYLKMPAKRIGSQLIVMIRGDEDACTISITPGIRDHNDTVGFYSMQNPSPLRPYLPS